MNDRAQEVVGPAMAGTANATTDATGVIRPPVLERVGALVAQVLQSRAFRVLGISTIAALGVEVALISPWNVTDTAIYRAAWAAMQAGDSPFVCAAAARGCYRYSPLVAPILGTLDPFVWRAFSIIALAWALRGTGPAKLAVIVNPFTVYDLIEANVTMVALALTIELVRHPDQVRLWAYAIFVALVPKPAFVPALLWGVWSVRDLRPLLAVGVGVGAVLPAVIGNADRILGLNVVGTLPWPTVAALGAGGLVLTALAIRRPALLGPAAVLCAGYWYPYAYAPLTLPLVLPWRRGASRVDGGTSR